MTDEAKALVERVAPTYAQLGGTSDRVRDYIYALEAQATRDERLIKTQAREIERLRGLVSSYRLQIDQLHDSAALGESHDQ